MQSNQHMNSGVFNRVRCARLALLGAAAAGWFAVSAQTPQAGAQDHRQPVLVELFTSEGCSDCPPADALLARLDSAQPIPGARVIVLSEHVTYWNHEGWRDPFSFDDMDLRQDMYVRQFGLEGGYTPQMVVDGAQQMVGNNAPAVTAAVARAASSAKSEIAIENAHLGSGDLEFSVRSSAAHGASVVAAVAQDATRSEVLRGENKGRTLHHVAVVRILKEFGSNAADGRSLRLSGSILSGADKTPLRLVVFLVDRKNGHVTAATEQTLGPVS
jgi:hypothetical protein